MRMRIRFAVSTLSALAFLMVTTVDAAELDREQASQALRRAVDYYTKNVATEGGYLYRYTEDLLQREGEKKATNTMVWVQPPGTPSVGSAYLLAYRATGDAYCLDAARAAASALVRGQLRSGGWGYSIEFDPKNREKFAYRVAPTAKPEDSKTAENVSILDDNNTQAAIRFLMGLDVVLDFKDVTIHEATRYALDQLAAAQYANGAWPQRFTGPSDPAKHLAKRADYPETWSRTYPKQQYSGYYTFNDNAMGDVIETMLEAAETYETSTYREAAVRCGDFMLLAQMPDPQPAWAQQYDFDMHPVWARKFEPPSITGGESQSILRSLMAIHRETGNRKYLNAIGPALAYLERSLLPDGRLARFYELQTNRPLYFTHDYKLTYDDSDVPTHYSFKTPSRLANIRKDYDRRQRISIEELRKPEKPKPRAKASREQIANAQQAVDTLDAQGRWLEEGRLRSSENSGSNTRILRIETFVQNVCALAEYLDATRSD